MPYDPGITPVSPGDPAKADLINKLIRAVRPPVAVGGYQSDNMNLQVPTGRGRKVRVPDLPTGTIQVYVCQITFETDAGDGSVLGLGSCDVYEAYTDGTLGFIGTGALINPFGAAVQGWSTCVLVTSAPPPSPMPSPSPGLMAEPTFRPTPGRPVGQFGGDDNTYLLIAPPANAHTLRVVTDAYCSGDDILVDKVVINYQTAAVDGIDEPSPAPPSPSPEP